MNHDNALPKLTRVQIETKNSPKTKNDYSVITYHFVNGYQHRVFLTNEQIFAIKDALNTDTNDNAFSAVDG